MRHFPGGAEESETSSPGPGRGGGSEGLSRPGESGRLQGGSVRRRDGYEGCEVRSGEPKTGSGKGPGGNGKRLQRRQEKKKGESSIQAGKKRNWRKRGGERGMFIGLGGSGERIGGKISRH